MKLIHVGVGGFGRTWLNVVAGRAGVEHAALVDVDERALETARAQLGLPASRCFADYRAAFAAVDADAVLCVTPPDMHRQVAEAAFAAGLHVLTEKPLADTMAGAVRMVEAAEAADRRLMVSQNYRFHPWVRTIRSLLESGEFSAPDNVFVRFAKAPRFRGSFRLKMEHPLVRDMSIHHFDLLRALTGREPVSVFARTWRPGWSWFEHDPCAVAVFEFDGGLQALYHGSWVARSAETTWNGYWCIECCRAAIELRGETVHLTPADHPEEDTEVELHRMPCEGQAYSLLEFGRAIAEGRAPETSGRDNLRSLAMVFAVTQSAARGEPVHIEQILQQR